MPAVPVRTAKATNKGYYNIKVVTDDGYTGTNFNRLGFQEAFALIQYRRVGRFIVMKKTLPLSMIHRKLLSPVKNMKRQRNAESQPNVRFRPEKSICLTIWYFVKIVRKKCIWTSTNTQAVRQIFDMYKLDKNECRCTLVRWICRRNETRTRAVNERIKEITDRLNTIDKTEQALFEQKLQQEIP